MATPVVMPQMGYDMKEGTVVKWLKKEGDDVTRGEPLAEIETDKAVISMEATAGGVLRRIFIQAGKPVPVGDVIGAIGAKDESDAAITATRPGGATATAVPAPAEAAAKGAASDSQASAAAGQPAPAAAADTGDMRATPVARRLAKEKNVDLARVKGTGPGGRITEQDVLAAEEAQKKARAAAAAPAAQPAAAAPAAAKSAAAPAPAVAQAPAAPKPAPSAPGAIGRQELTKMRQAIARITSQSQAQVPHFYIKTEIDMTAAMELRKGLNDALQSDGVRVSVNDIIVKATALATAKYPYMNSFYKGDYLQTNSDINVGIAIALDSGGLVVPALLRCQTKSLVQLAKEAKDLISRAQKQTFSQEEAMGATISTSNLGMYEMDEFAAVILPPQACMLALGSVRDRAVVRDKAIVSRQTMFATAAVDHRVADGAEASKFLMEFKRLLEHPTLLLV